MVLILLSFADKNSIMDLSQLSPIKYFVLNSLNNIPKIIFE